MTGTWFRKTYVQTDLQMLEFLSVFHHLAHYLNLMAALTERKPAAIHATPAGCHRTQAASTSAPLGLIQKATAASAPLQNGRRRCAIQTAARCGATRRHRAYSQECNEQGGAHRYLTSADSLFLPAARALDG